MLSATPTTRTALAAVTFAAVLACSDRNDADRTSPVGAEGRDPAMAEREYAEDREALPRAADEVLRPGTRAGASSDPAGTASDQEIARTVREGVSADESLSMQARNVEVLARDGAVTLRGSVASGPEKAEIESLARRAGGTRIHNELEGDPDEPSGQRE